MLKRMLINCLESEESRIAVTEDGLLQEFYLERAARETLVGDIYKGRVVNVLPGLAAAFVDIGLEQNGFLHASEVMIVFRARAEAMAAAQQALAEGRPVGSPAEGGPGNGNGNGNGGEDSVGERGDAGPPAPGEGEEAESAAAVADAAAPAPGAAAESAAPARSARPRTRRREADIARLLSPGQDLLVQVTRDGIGDKGPSVTLDVSVPGRFLVLTPRVPRIAVSKKIQNPEDREELKQLLTALNPPKGLGYIIRTAGSDKSHRDLKADLDALLKTWSGIVARAKAADAPACVYRDSDLALRTIRDIFTPDTQEVWIDSPAAYESALEFFKLSLPRSAGRVKLYREPTPIFHRFGIEHQIDQLYQRRVELPSGGSLVIDPTEALVAIDVNSGRFTRERSPEEMAYQTNMEAATEIVRQLRLRDLGGQIVLDFIDMKEARHRQELEKRLRAELKRDRSRSTVLKMSRLGLVEMAREKLGGGVKLLTFEMCPSCRGTGLIKTVESMTLQVLRQVRLNLANPAVAALEVRVHPDVATALQNLKRRELARLEEQFGITIAVVPQPGARVELSEIASFDATKQRIK